MEEQEYKLDDEFLIRGKAVIPLADEYIIKAFTDGKLRKGEYPSYSEVGKALISGVPSEIFQGNEDKVTLISSEGPVKGFYFNVGVEFDDLTFEHDNVRLVSLKYNKDTKEHYYKYYVLYNPLDIQMDNIVSTGFFSNDNTKVTVYVVPKVSGDELEDSHFVFEHFKGITIDIATGETLMETDYEATSPEGSQG